ncbi:FMN-dependent NADH-azoreductase [Adonisia turfae]|uniref:FMN dependent NADH:quinone oxidoreductase n=1 Tax=Adonisia turfae CCMR0081 TaxID=2292702 RepID=A0A6M0RHM3_9CYAN|nr:FMN-dependent NADH-azoreductase [Adonisia turfae]NEZ55420.1 FMN-dependent NADH-azoreductase [Adonisia turfae CCMR0081]
MANILHIDSSPRGGRSKSRQLAKEFVMKWQTLHLEDVITYRDLRKLPVPHLTEEWIAADYTPQDKRTVEMTNILRVSDELVDELLAADRCIFSVPMYNFSIPSGFKAYIDHVVRVGRTFTFTDGQFKGLTEGKKVLFITARGDEYGADSTHAGWDAQEPSLRFAFQFIGMTDIQFIHANGLDLGDEARQRGLNDAREKIQKLVVNW